MENSTETTPMTLNRVVSWVGASVPSTFFTSLECWSCINLSAIDFDDEDEEETKDRPLMLTHIIVHDALKTTSLQAIPRRTTIVSSPDSTPA